MRTLDRCAASTKWTSSGPRAQIRSTGAGLRADPRGAWREGRHGDVLRLRSHGAGILLASPGRPNEEDRVTQRTWDRIEEARERWNVLRHPFYRRWSAGELSARGAGALLGPVPARGAGDRRGQRGRRGRRSRAARAAPPRRRGARPRRALGRLRRGGGRERRRPPDAGDRGVRACVVATGTVRAGGDDLLARLVTLYAIESGQPEISRTKREGLVGATASPRVRAPRTSASTSAATPSTPPRPAS